MTEKERIYNRILALEVMSGNRYGERYDNDLFLVAIAKKSTRYANSLIDEALALCGSSHYHVGNRQQWSKEALAFLAEFC